MQRHPDFHWDARAPGAATPWFQVARRVRGALDYVYFLGIGEDRVPYLVQRSARRAPRLSSHLMRMPGPGRGGTEIDGPRCSTCATARSREKRVQRLIHAYKPDVVLVTPHLMPARPTPTTRGARSDRRPDRGLRAELGQPLEQAASPAAVRTCSRSGTRPRSRRRDLHGIPADRVVVTGAQCFDHWFGWPPRPREEFCDVSASTPRSRTSSSSAARSSPPTDRGGVLPEWIQEVRASNEPALREASILIRSHPKRNHEWHAARLLRIRRRRALAPPSCTCRGGRRPCRLLRLDLPQCRRRRGEHERDDRGGRRSAAPCTRSSFRSSPRRRSESSTSAT